MALAEQVLQGATIELAGTKVTVTHRCIVMSFGAVIVAATYPTAVRVVAGESTTTFALPW